MNEKDVKITLPNGHAVLFFESEGETFLALVNPKGYIATDLKMSAAEVEQVKRVFNE